MSSSIDGLSSGLDTSSIINQLMQLERRPQVALTTRRDQEQAARTELSEIRSDLSAVRNQAADLRLSSGFDAITATSSNPEAVSVTASSAATTGSYTFEVTQTAAAASVYSDQVYTSLDDATGAVGISSFSASGFQGVGFTGFQGNNFPDGPITVEVVQGSEPAKVVGGIPTIPITVDGTNDGIDFDVDGFNFSVTLEHGTYNTEQALADAFQAAIAGNSAASDAATASLNASNQIELTTRNEGSARVLTITGGTAMTDLGFSLGQAGSGVDGLVEVDGVVTAITDTTPGTAVTLASAGAGTIEATVSGGVRTGSITAEQSTSGGSLQEVVNAINAADQGYSALAVNTGSGYRLQLTADETGAASAIDTGTGEFGTMTFTQLNAGRDAVLTVQGDNPLTITSSDNTFEELLPGVSVTVNDVTTTPVTVTTEQDVESVTESVGALVTSVNELLSRISSSTSNNPDGNRTVLQGNREARRAADQIRNALVSPVDDNPLTSLGVIGIELTREGTLNFNQDAFAQAFASDPDAVSALFTAEAGGEPGALDRLVDAAEGATSVGTGYLYTAGEAADQRIDDYGRQIDAFERRLELRESTLRQTYANLEVALSGLQQQSSYLASQLAGLSGGSA